MKRQRIVLAALGTIIIATAAACGGSTPTASDLDLQARLNPGGGFFGSGHAAGGIGFGSGHAAGGGIGSGGVMSGTGTGGSTEPADTTKRIGFIGSGG